MDLDEIVKLTKELDEMGGIDIGRLPPGTKLEVQTAHNLYKLEKLDYGVKYSMQGGKYWPEATEVRIPGCTFGGSTIRTNWIGYGMKLEIYENRGTFHTSSVRNVKIIGPTFEYSMNWHPEDTSENKEE